MLRPIGEMLAGTDLTTYMERRFALDSTSTKDRRRLIMAIAESVPTALAFWIDVPLPEADLPQQSAKADTLLLTPPSSCNHPVRFDHEVKRFPTGSGLENSFEQRFRMQIAY
mmetsp:Transcript_41527/g.111292  ORF Transcript_41527/g.111292 Transcript_41527/m.111292 type:complete len:112 (+) Transcript_41527:6703-7038(+)